MGLLTRDQLLVKQPLKIKKVMITEQDFVYVREMNGREKDAFEASFFKEVKKGRTTDWERSLGDYRAKLVVRCVCNQGGSLLLRSEDYEVLSTNMGARQLDIIIEVAQELNKISDIDRDNLLKNSEGVQKDASTSEFVKS